MHASRIANSVCSTGAAVGTAGADLPARDATSASHAAKAMARNTKHESLSCQGAGNVFVGRKGWPEEESAFWLGPRDEIAELAPERSRHDRPLLLVVRAQSRQSRGDDAALPHFVHDPLVERAGTQIGGLFGDFELRGDVWRRGDPRDAEPRRDSL